jgi:hypothetical protein
VQNGRVVGWNRKEARTMKILIIFNELSFYANNEIMLIFDSFLERSIERLRKPLSQQLNNTLKTISISPFNEFIFSSNPRPNGIKTA